MDVAIVHSFIVCGWNTENWEGLAANIANIMWSMCTHYSNRLPNTAVHTIVLKSNRCAYITGYSAEE